MLALNNCITCNYYFLGGTTLAELKNQRHNFSLTIIITAYIGGKVI